MVISKRSTILFVGAGGTGGYAIPNIIRMASHLPNGPEIIIMDADKVEEKNCNRQNFVVDDIGEYKAEVLAKRYGFAFGTKVSYINSFLDKDNIYSICDPYRSSNYRNPDTYLIIDTVDNIRTRLIINEFVKSRNRYTNSQAIAWLSCGNTDTFGQIVYYDSLIVNSRTVVDVYPHEFNNEEAAKEEEIEREQRQNCATNALLNPQSLAVNLLAGTLITNMVYSMYVDNDLKYDMVLFNRTGKVRFIEWDANPFIEKEFDLATLLQKAS